MTTGAEWWRGCVIYEIYPRSFRDLNGDGIGDLAGATETLGHIADLGADAIWLTPFYDSPMKDFGYDVADYRKVAPMFGSDADFDALVTRAHDLGLKVIIDQVISHTSDQHPWFAESRSSRNNPRADWYVWADRKRDGNPPNNWLSVFGGPSWQWDTRREQYYLHNFLVEQPDLNLHNPEVQDAVLADMKFWLERGVDGFRLDALNFGMHDPRLRDNPPASDATLSEQPSSNPYSCQEHLHDKSQPEMEGVIQRIRALLDQYGATTSVAEIGDGLDRTLTLMSDYAGGPGRLHMCYGFDFLGPRFSAEFVRHTIIRYAEGAADAWPCWAFSNHDCERHVSRWSRTPGDGPQLARFALGLLLALRGSVILYQGEELGLPEANIPFEELQDPAGKAFWPEYKGRDGCRTPIPWTSEAPNGGFGSGKPWLRVPEDHLKLSVAAQKPDPASLMNFYKQALAVRKQTAALLTGGIECALPEPDLLEIRRAHDDATVVCQYNFGDAAKTVATEGEIIFGAGAEGDNLAPFGFRWMRG